MTNITGSKKAKEEVAVILSCDLNINAGNSHGDKNMIINQTFDTERALYHLTNTEITGCHFAGSQDGESVLKEASNITLTDCDFSLRYPMWHVKAFELINSRMDDKARAPIWYAEKGTIADCTINSTKCLRECSNIQIIDSNIASLEFGWKCQNLRIENTSIESEYFLLDSRNIEISHLNMKGKYSFQYVENLTISDSNLDTKDAFWHSTNVTVRNSVIKGEHLGWFSDGLTLIDCRIIGTQPLCYCKNLKLINCIMEETDLAFEYSDVEAKIHGHVLSIKNPKSGTIVLDSVGEIIFEDAVMVCSGKVLIREVPLQREIATQPAEDESCQVTPAAA